jgi:PAS domain S-box-containing protein
MDVSSLLSQIAIYTSNSLTIVHAGTFETLYVNNSFTLLTGYEPEDVVGKPLKLPNGDNINAEAISEIKKAIANRTTLIVELLDHRKNGEEYWAEINLTPLPCPKTGSYEYFLISKRDITRRKKFERQIIVDMQAAEAATNAKSEFLANMSHELRTPMNGILGLTEILQHMDVPTDVRECVDAIHSSGTSLLGILNDILDLSKIEAGELAIESYSFSTREILKNIRDLSAPAASKKGLIFSIRTGFDIPDHLIGDGKRIQQVIFNLVGNALKFTEDGEVSLFVDWIKKDKKDMLVIEVKDTGIGIPDGFQERLFDKFSQADTSISRKFGGTGLGLAITKHLITMMNGTITFTSSPDLGTSFFVSLPLQEARHDVVSESAPPLENRDFSGARILLVEDHPINQMLVLKWLQRLGIKQVDAAPNGFDTLSLLRNNSYDVVLMDCQMPELDGYETTSLIRDTEKQLNIHIPIIAMTANAMLGEREKCLAAGMDDYMSKPLDFKQFRKKITHWLNKRSNFNSESLDDLSPPEEDELLLATSTPVDLTRLREFTEGDKETELMVINLFLSSAYETVDKIRAAKEEDDARNWQEAIHRFKGSSGNLGAMSLHALCAEAEGCGHLPQEEKELLFSAIFSEFSKVENYLKNIN